MQQSEALDKPEIIQITFETTGMKRPSENVPSPSQLATNSEGVLTIGESSLSFCEWRIPYDSIKSAILRTEYHFAFPSYDLLITDGFSNYLFHVPRRYVNVALTFSVQREVDGSW